MRAFNLMPLISIVFALGGYLIPFNYDYAYAGCCSPCTCYGWCWCPGVMNCPKYQCDRDDSTILQMQAMNSKKELHISGSYVSSPPPAPRGYSIDRMIARSIPSQCDRDNYLMKFFKHTEDRLRFEQDFLNYNVSEDNNAQIVAKQMPK